VKAGDLVRGWSLDIREGEEEQAGIIIEVIDHIEDPPACKVLWASGDIGKERTDDIEVISENKHG